MKKNRLVNVVRYFILIIVNVKYRSERSRIFPFNSSEEKHRSGHNQIFHFNSIEVKEPS